MQPMNTTTGHNPRMERKVARVLYVSIGVAILAGLVFFFILGRNKPSMNPYQTNEVNTVAPDSAPGSNSVPGTIATPGENPLPQNEPITR